MGAYAGNTFWWLATDTGKIWSSLTGAVQSGLALNLDAGVSASYPGSGSTWTDLTSAGNNATLFNSPTYNSSNGGSIVFNSASNYLTGTISCNKTYYTWDIWIYPTTITDSNWAMGFNDGWNDFLIHTTSGAGIYVGQLLGSRRSPWRNNVLVANTWNNITVTWDNGIMKFYKNAALEVTATLGLTSRSSFTSYFVGQGGGPTNNPAGRISNFRIYSGKVLTANEITQNFNALRGRFGI